MTAESHFDEYEFGASWVQRESMERGSHALRDAGRVWLVDPVDSGDDVDRAIGDGEPAGVIQLLNRHNRDCEAISERLGVPHLRLPDSLPGTPFMAFRVIDRPMWREVGIWWPERKALVVTEAVGTGKELAVADTGIAVHPFLRLIPPGAIRPYTDVAHFLPGHGHTLHDPDLGRRIQEALDRSRSDFPHLVARIPSLIRDARK